MTPLRRKGTDLGGWLTRFVRTERFLRRYPHYAAILAKLDPIDDPAVDVMAVSHHDGRFYLHVNIDFFVDKPQFLVGVLLHEVHHIVLGHVTHPKFKRVAHPDVMELAMEISANEFIEEPLPGSPARWRDYSSLGIARGQSTLHRYDVLVAAQRDGANLADWAPTDDHLRSGVDPEPSRLDPTSPAGQWHLRRLLKSIDDLLTEDSASPSPLEMLRRRGDGAGAATEALDETERPPRRAVDWRHAIEMFAGEVRSRAPTYDRPNRRLPDLVGIVPGSTYRVTRADRPSLLVAIDTSGSMSIEELAEIARHLRPLEDLAAMTIAECDAAIQRVYPFEGTVREVGGRGGTDLRPVFDAAFLREHPCDGVVYFTDGDGPYPSDEPAIPTLWVLSGNEPFACPWGVQVKLAT